MLTFFENLLNQMNTLEFWITFLEAFKDLGPLAPIFLAFIESLIPALPLVAIVTFNITVHGAVLGFLYSWIGSTVGCYLVFCFFRHIVKRYLVSWLKTKKTLKKGLDWVAQADARILFVLAMLPFTPSSFLNMAFGLSDFNQKTFFITLGLAKSLMMAGLAMFGGSLVLSFENPWYLLLAAAVLVILLAASRYTSHKHGLK